MKSITAEHFFAVVPEWVIDADISDRAFRLYAVLRRHADKATGYARPSREHLATRMRTSVKSIDRALRELEELGAVEVHPRWRSLDRNSYAFARDAEHTVRAPSGYVLQSHPPASRGVTSVAPSDQEIPSGSTHRKRPAKDTRDAEQGTPVSLGGDTGVARVATPVTQEPESLEPEKELSSATPPKRKRIEPERRDVETLCSRLAQRMTENGCKPPKITDTWRRAARLLLDTDRRDPNEAARLIDWCQADQFWRSNVESMPTFRRQYDRLRLKSGNAARPQAAGRVWQE